MAQIKGSKFASHDLAEAIDVVVDLDVAVAVAVAVAVDVDVDVDVELDTSANVHCVRRALSPIGTTPNRLKYRHDKTNSSSEGRQPIVNVTDRNDYTAALGANASSAGATGSSPDSDSLDTAAPRANASTPDRLRIVLGCDTFAPDVNGAARFAERLAAGLVERGHEVHVIAPGLRWRRARSRVEVIEGVPMTVHRPPAVRWLPHDWLRFVLPWRAKHYVRQILDQVQADVIHIQSHIVLGRALSKEAERRGIRLIATNHVMPENVLDFTLLPPWAENIFVRWAWRDADTILGRAAAVTTPTRRAADFLERSTKRRGVLAVSCGLRASNYTADLTPRKEHKLVFVGRVTLEKSIDVTLKALTRLDPALNVTLTIVGDGDQRKQLESLASELGVSDRVHFTGRVSDDELRQYLTEASIFVIASIAELQSIATMEAMASGLPIIAADAMALPHLVTEGENGYLFQPGNDRELADQITSVLTLSPDEYVRMQQASLDAVSAHDLDRTLDTFERLYRGEDSAA